MAWGSLASALSSFINQRWGRSSTISRANSRAPSISRRVPRIGSTAAMTAPSTAMPRKAGSSWPIRRQGIAPARWKRQAAVSIPASTPTRLVPLATLGGRPRDSSRGRVIAVPLEAAALRKPQTSPPPRDHSQDWTSEGGKISIGSAAGQAHSPANHS